ncbi:TRAP transporter small permease [Shinella sp.]|uniref:TRAP transporter small permease n=1 Tax=Shinella sp. TaxID=1870904 RepID=UPI0028A112B1|nr:TRAP transporter small permease [Shinella sp.]
MVVSKPRMVARRIGEAAIIVLFGIMVASAVGQVISRYVFNAPLTWSEELSRYVFIWLSFLGVWYAWVRREHLGIDVLPQMLPPRPRRLLMTFLEFTVLVFAIASLYYGQRILEVSIRQPSAVLRVPMAWIYVSYYVAMTLVSLEILLDWFSRWRHPVPETEG